MKTELKIKKDVEVDGKQTFSATVDKKNGLEMMGAGRAVNFAETEMRNTSLWDFFLQMLEYDKTKDEAGDKFKKIVLSIFPKLPYKLLKENYTSPEARDTLRKYLQLLGWRNGGYSYTDKSHKPPGWPDALSFDDFAGPHAASIEDSMTILRSIFLHHQYDPDTHVEDDNNNGERAKKKRKRKSNKAKSRALIDPEVEEENIQVAGAERDEPQEVEVEDGDREEGQIVERAGGEDDAGLQTSDIEADNIGHEEVEDGNGNHLEEAADDMDQEDSLSDSIADAMNSAEDVDSSVEEGEITSGQQNKRKTQEVDSEDSASKSEYENLRDKNIQERQQLMNQLGLNNLFAKKTTVANKKKRTKQSPPAEPRKSARLAQKDHT